MRFEIILALLCTALASPAVAQGTQSLTNCIDDLSGHACLLSPAASAMTDADYGTVYVQITPPKSVTEQTIKVRKGGWKSWVRRFFLPQTKSGALVAEIFQGSNKIAVIPVTMFSIDESKGVNVETGNSFQAMQQATPYFALDPVSNPIRVVLTLQSSKDQSSRILGTFTSVTSAAKSLGASGYLLTAGVNPVAAALQPIERAISDNFDAKSDSKLELGFNFESNTGADFTFGFDPSNRDRSGRITFQLVRRGSLFGNYPVASQRPVFSFRDRTDAGAANDILLRQPTGKPLRVQLQTTTAGQFDRLQQGDIRPAEFEAACSVVEAAILAQGTNSHDIVAMMWATLIGGGGIRRADLRSTMCLTKWMSTFAIYGLKLPDVDPGSRPQSALTTVDGDKKLEVADLSESALRAFMSSLFQIMAQQGSSEVRIRAFQSMLSSSPHPLIELDQDFGLASLDDSANARFVAEKMSALSFRSGCFIRRPDKTVRYLARVLSPSTLSGQSLLLMDLLLESQRQPPTANSATINRWSIRNAKLDDMGVFAAAFPDRPACSDFVVAPN